MDSIMTNTLRIKHIVLLFSLLSSLLGINSLLHAQHFFEPLTPSAAKSLSIDPSWTNYDMRSTDHHALYLAYRQESPNAYPVLKIDGEVVDYQVDDEQCYWLKIRGEWKEYGKLVEVTSTRLLFKDKTGENFLSINYGSGEALPKGSMNREPYSPKIELTPQNPGTTSLVSNWDDFDKRFTEHSTSYLAYRDQTNGYSMYGGYNESLDYLIDEGQCYWVKYHRVGEHFANLLEKFEQRFQFDVDYDDDFNSTFFDCPRPPAIGFDRRGVFVPKIPLTRYNALSLSVDPSWANYDMGTTDHRALYLAFRKRNRNTYPMLRAGNRVVEYQVDVEQCYWIKLRGDWMNFGQLVEVTEQRLLFREMDGERLCSLRFDNYARIQRGRETLTPWNARSLSVDPSWANYDMRTTDHRALYMAFCRRQPNTYPMLLFRDLFVDYQVDDNQCYWVRLRGEWQPLGRLVEVTGQGLLFEDMQGGGLKSIYFDRGNILPPTSVLREPLTLYNAILLSIDPSWENYDMRSTDHRMIYLAFRRRFPNTYPTLFFGGNIVDYQVDDNQCYWFYMRGEWQPFGRLVEVTARGLLFEALDGRGGYSIEFGR